MMLPDEPDEEKCGYGRPPKRHQFKPGQSGNPKGRPRKRRSDKALDISDALSEPVRIIQKGRAKPLHWYEAAIRSGVQKALKNNSKKDAMMVLKEAQKYGVFAVPENGSGVVIYPHFMTSDDALYIINNYGEWKQLFEDWSNGGDRTNYEKIQADGLRKSS